MTEENQELGELKTAHKKGGRAEREEKKGNIKRKHHPEYVINK